MMKFLDSKIGKWWFWMLGLMIFLNLFIFLPLSWFYHDLMVWTIGAMLLWCVPAIPFIFLGCLGYLVKEFIELRGK